MTNVVRSVDSTVADHPDAVALRVSGTATSYERFDGLVESFAGGLRESGIGSDDRVALLLPNLPQHVVALHGTLRVGAVAVPILDGNGAPTDRLEAADPDAVMTVAARRSAIESAAVDPEVTITVGGGGDATGFLTFLGDDANGEIEPRDEDDPAVMAFTAGTMGPPRAAKLTHGNVRAATEGLAAGIGPDDVVPGVLPLAHTYGMAVANAALVSGTTYVPLPDPDADELHSTVTDERATVLHGSPAIYMDLLDADRTRNFDADFSSLRYAVVAGGRVPRSLPEEFEDRYGVPLVEGYGLTETAGLCSVESAASHRSGAAGRAIPHADVAIVDEEFEERPALDSGPVDPAADEPAIGEIVVAGETVAAGYRDETLPMTEEAGTCWLHTGDLGYWDADGFVYPLSRSTDAVEIDGRTVVSRPAEERLLDEKWIGDAAVIADDEEFVGFVVPMPDAEPSPEAVRAALDSLPPAWQPRRVTVVDRLPRTPLGGIRRGELRSHRAD